MVACSRTDKDVFDGSYRGDGVDSQSASNVKEFTLNLSSSGSVVSGTYTIKAVILDTSGSVSGTLSGADLTLTLTPGPGVSDCPYRISGAWEKGKISGTYLAFNCFVRSDGALTLKKR